MPRLFLLFSLIGLALAENCIPLAHCDWLNWLQTNYNVAGVTQAEVAAAIAERNCGGTNVRCDEVTADLPSTSFGGGVIGTDTTPGPEQCSLQIFHKTPFDDQIVSSFEGRLIVPGVAYRLRVHGSCCWRICSLSFFRIPTVTLPSGFDDVAMLHPRSARPVPCRP